MICGTDDIEKVARVLMDDSVFPFTTDDGSPSKDDFPMWPILEDKRIFVLMPNEDTVAVLFPMNCVTYDFHFNALKHSRGKLAIWSANEVFQYMFLVTKCQKLFAQVPSLYPNVVEFYRKIGMGKEGVSEKSFLKNDKLHDQIIFGLTKEKYQCHGQQQQ